MNNLGTERLARQVTTSLLAILLRKTHDPICLHCKTNDYDGGNDVVVVVDDDETRDTKFRLIPH